MFEILNSKDIINSDLEYPDIYFTHNYGKLCEITDSGLWKCIVYNKGELLIPFIERMITINNKRIIHLVSNYGYGGIYISPKLTIRIEELIQKLMLFMKNNNYITHFLRFSPYFDINKCKEFKIINNSDVYLKCKTYGIVFKNTNYGDYFKNTKKNHKRSLKKSNDKLKFILRNFQEEDINGTFQPIYKETMDRVKSVDYYYFNNQYYDNLYKYCKDYVFIAEVLIKDTEEIIASAIIFNWKNKYLHYHLGGSKTKYLKLCPNNFLHDSIIQYGFQNNYELYHLGGGVSNGDSLENFKESFSNTSFDYYQAKLIYDKDDYDINCKSAININKNSFPIYING